jgi:DNA repair protein RecO (recombination protein O)
MNIDDISVVIEKKLLKEDSAIIKVLTKNYGIYSGVIKIDQKKKKKYLPEKSDLVHFFWQARLSEHIGYCKVELINPNFSLVMLNKAKLYSINSILELISICFKERDPYPLLFDNLLDYLKLISSSDFSFLNYILMETYILKECGYGLDLSKCASKGTSDNLYYVSPKSAKAVSKEAGEAYKNSLLKLPQFILLNKEPIEQNDVREAKQLTEYFLRRYLVPNERDLYSRDLFFALIESKICT